MLISRAVCRSCMGTLLGREFRLPRLGLLAIAALAAIVVVHGQSAMAAAVERANGGSATQGKGMGEGERIQEMKTGVRVDCLNSFNVSKGGTQDCLSLSGLRASFVTKVGERATGTIRLDPFASPDIAQGGQPSRSSLPKASDSSLGIVDNMSLTWQARPALAVSIETHDGDAAIPVVSGLAFSGGLQDLGWRQLALTLSYDLKAPLPMTVRFAAGNGEGESVVNQDPQQYFGFRADLTLLKGLHGTIGGSFDGNNMGSDARMFQEKQLVSSCAVAPTTRSVPRGHSTQRLGVGFYTDGGWVGAQGLRLGVGWQRTTAIDLDRRAIAEPTVDELIKGGCRIDAGRQFFEDAAPEKLNAVRRNLFAFTINYTVLSRYFVAGSYETRMVDTGTARPWRVCHQFSGTSCAAPEEVGGNHLGQDAFSVGGGLDLDTGLRLAVEYFRAKYDKAYVLANFIGQNGNAGQTSDAINARVTYAWD